MVSTKVFQLNKRELEATVRAAESLSVCLKHILKDADKNKIELLYMIDLVKDIEEHLIEMRVNNEETVSETSRRID